MTKQVLIVIFLIGFLALGVKAQTCTSGQVPIWDATLKWTCGSPQPGPLPTGGSTNMTVANAGTTGTTINRFAKLTGAPSTAIITAVSDIDGAIGVVISGAGTTGNAIIAILGQVTCDFDNATTAGDYVVISAITAGKCHDAGNAYVTSSANYGRVLTTNGGAGAYVIELMTPDLAFQNAGSGKSKPGGSNTQVQYNSNSVFGGSSYLVLDTATTGQVATTSGAVGKPGLSIGGTGNCGFSDSIGGTAYSCTGDTQFRLVFGDGTAGAGTTNTGGYYFSSTAAATGSIDTGIERESAGLLRVVNGLSQYRDIDVRAYFINGKLLASTTAPTVTGFGTSPSVPNNNGTAAFTINVGGGGAASTGSITLPTATTGWVCTLADVTNPASSVTSQTGGTATTATVTNYSRTTGIATAWAANDILRVSCFAY